MANEVRVTTKLTANRGSFSFDTGRTAQFNGSAVYGGNPGTVAFTTTEEDIAFVDVTPGWVHMINLSTSNWFRVGPKSGTMIAAMKLPPGGFALFPASTGTTYTGKAVSSTVNVLIQGLSGPATT